MKGYALNSLGPSYRGYEVGFKMTYNDWPPVLRRTALQAEGGRPDLASQSSLTGPLRYARSD